MEYHVSQSLTSTDHVEYLKSISQAAAIAVAGDTIIVHNGIYRECVDPKNGGTDGNNRIVYRAAQDEKVIIKGSEEIKNWCKTEDGIWKVEIDNAFFNDYNPYLDQIYGDWFIDNGRIHHTGEVYINGKSMFEMDTLDRVIHPAPVEQAAEKEWSLHTWYCEADNEKTTIWANFGTFDPAENRIEINVRRRCFWPLKEGINYITVSGFEMSQAATQWAPPTALQDGLLGTHWSCGWIIEKNTISNSKCSGISLGKNEATGHNEWSRLRVKHGTQREREVIFRAIHDGWCKEKIGSHIVRQNTIFSCEQTGICGHLGSAFCTIEDNYIYDIHTKHLFEGAEIGGIKVHAAIDTLIRHNKIINCYRGLWLDWQAQGIRVTRNFFAQNEEEDIFIEVSHGPCVMDNNILLSKVNLRNFSQGTAFVHNLFTGSMVTERVTNRFTPYHFPHETGVAGLMTILGGDDRFYNNLFIGNGDEKCTVGLSTYNNYPTAVDAQKQYDQCRWVDHYACLSLPMYCGGNIYVNGATAYKSEKNSLETTEDLIQSTYENGKLTVIADVKLLSAIYTEPVTSELLGAAFEPEARFENSDGTALTVDIDFCGIPMKTCRPIPGPFSELDCGIIATRLLYGCVPTRGARG